MINPDENNTVNTTTPLQFASPETQSPSTCAHGLFPYTPSSSAPLSQSMDELLIMASSLHDNCLIGIASPTSSIPLANHFWNASSPLGSQSYEIALKYTVTCVLQLIFSKQALYDLLCSNPTALRDYYLSEALSFFDIDDDDDEEEYEDVLISNFCIMSALGLIMNDAKWESSCSTKLDDLKLTRTLKDVVELQKFFELNFNPSESFDGNECDIGSVGYCKAVLIRSVHCGCFKQYRSFDVDDSLPNNNNVEIRNRAESEDSNSDESDSDSDTDTDDDQPTITAIATDDGEQIKCTVCSAPESPAKRMPRCGGCKIMPFCSKICQELGWVEHKKECMNMRKLRILNEERIKEETGVM